MEGLGFISRSQDGHLLLGSRELTCEDRLEVKMLIGDRAAWIDTRIEFTGKEYRLAGIQESPEGLIAHIK